MPESRLACAASFDGRGRPKRARSPVGVAVLTIATAAVGLTAATALTLDKLTLLAHPSSPLSCNFSALVGCSTGLSSWQGSLLGFPNSIVGMAAWTVLLALGIVMLTASEFSRIVWVGLNVALTAAFALVVFLIAQSIFVLGVLCPWCMATWAVTIPIFFAITAFNLSTWARAPRLRRAGRFTFHWLPLITLLSFLVVAILAQVRLGILQSM